MIEVRKEDLKLRGRKPRIMSEFCYLVYSLISSKKLSLDEIEFAYNLGKIEGKEGLKKKSVKVQSYKINAENKEQAIKQVKTLELPKEVEKDIIEIIEKQ